MNLEQDPQRDPQRDPQGDPHPTDWLPAFALGILEPDEQSSVEAHLERCPACRAEAAALVEVTNLLALGVPLLVAPDALRQRVLDEAGRVPAAPGEVDKGHRWNRVGQALRRFLTLPLWRPAAAGLILLLLISNLYFLYRLRQLENQPPVDQQTILLGGTDAAPEAGGVLLIREGEPIGTLVVNGLPPLGPEQQYQLWLVRDETRVSGAVFSVVEQGFTSVTVSAPDALPVYTRFGITIEPAGGSPGPTGDGVLRSASPDTNDG